MLLALPFSDVLTVQKHVMCTIPYAHCCHRGVLKIFLLTAWAAPASSNALAVSDVLVPLLEICG